MTSQRKPIAVRWVEDNQELVLNVHRKLWDLAEVGLQELQSARVLVEILQAAGFHVQEGVAGMPSAFVATYGSGSPVIGLMGELDALPGLSQKVQPTREPRTPGKAGHGCGHHSYAASALGAALALKDVIDRAGMPGTVRVLGCPAEETLVGKVYMVRDGVFDGLDFCYGHHPAQMNTVRMSSGNAMNSMKFEFYGVAAHAGSTPEQGISSLDAVELMNVGVNFMREHVVQEARIHYVIEDGGHEPNVVPAYARSWYYVRAPRRDLVDRYYARILKVADGADLMAGTTHKVTFLTGVHDTISNTVLADIAVANMHEIGAPTYSKEEYEFAHELAKSIPREQKLDVLRKLSSQVLGAMELADVDLTDGIYDPYGDGLSVGGSSDVGDVSWNLPTQQIGTAMFLVGAPGHSWQNVAMGGSTIGEKSTIFASKVMAASCIDLVEQPDLLLKAHEDWQWRMTGLTYKSPLPPDLPPPLDQLGKGH